MGGLQHRTARSESSLHCWVGDLDMARRSREGEMRLGRTLVGDITLLEVVEVLGRAGRLACRSVAVTVVGVVAQGPQKLAAVDPRLFQGLRSRGQG